MALKLKLKPNERVVINGAVLVNSDRASSLIIENKANVLRETDIMLPEQANTPAKRIYVPIMMMIVEQGRTATLFKEFETRLTQFADVVTDAAVLEICPKLAANVANGNFYKALTLCRELVEYEKEVLAHVA